MPRDRYVHLCYELKTYYDRIGQKNWISYTKYNFYSNGFGYVWVNLDTTDHTMFLSEYIERLVAQYYHYADA